MSTVSRRIFLKESLMAAGAFLVNPNAGMSVQGDRNIKPIKQVKITISRVSSNFEREPLIRPFGFKGGYMTEIWQTVSFLESSSGTKSTGLCTQSVLWSDADIFSAYSESGGNALMYAMTERALQMAKRNFTIPEEAFSIPSLIMRRCSTNSFHFPVVSSER